MRIVIALGGNAPLRRADPMTTEVRRRTLAVAVTEFAAVPTQQLPPAYGPPSAEARTD